jgi:Glycogen recognition site of AMP-activated protein kinase
MRGNLSTIHLIELKPTEFHLEAPFAESVKLAADFTEWEKFPLDMMKSEDGVWYTTVPLPPGHYSYRFIVDGEWCDDPRSMLRLHTNGISPALACVTCFGRMDLFHDVLPGARSHCRVAML